MSTDATFATRNDPLLVKTADGCPLSLRRYGPRDDDRSPAVLLMAGGDGAMRWWRALLPDLCLDDDSRAAFAALAPAEPFHAALQVVVWDARGGGWAGRGHGVAAPGPAAADALRIARGLFKRSVHLVGHALGGVAALLAALEDPQACASLTLISTPLSAEGVATEALAPLDRTGLLQGLSAGWAERHDDVARALVREVEREAAWRGVLEAQPAGRRIELEPEGAGWRASALTRLDLEGRLTGLRVPLLVVHGSADAVVPVAHATELVRRVGGAARLLELDGGHLLPVERAADLAAAVEAHVRAAEESARDAAAGRSE
jgi:pimeloyl-ACP methyl ester carboxylesterase